MLIRPSAYWKDQRVEMLLGRSATSIDATAKRLKTDEGGEYSYSHLIWAAGADARRLSCAGHDLSGVHTVRHKGDADALAGELSTIKRVVVIGGGYIGLEAAAVMRKLGKQVVLLEAGDRVLGRVAGQDISSFYQESHRLAGVDLRLNSVMLCLEGNAGHVSAVTLEDGTSLPCECVIVGIGVSPTIAPLIEAGADSGNGVRVDEHCRTSLPDIFAIGDCAEHRNTFADDAWVRLESVQNATDMANTAASWICGEPKPYVAAPRFWSDQYDLKLQTIGLSLGHDQTVMRGDPSDRSFSVVYLKNGEVRALDCVNNAKDFAQGRSLVLNRSEVDTQQLSNPEIALKQLVPARTA
jgi:3-phenylpropionate/trans-cinnamate dioxygenase ferredoxin reductase subunit